MTDMNRWYYTFGPGHVLPFKHDANPAPQHVFVEVNVPKGIDPRGMVVSFFQQATRQYDAFGSSLFAGEYVEGADSTAVDRITLTKTCIGVITVEPACQQCQWAESQCKCVPGEGDLDA